MPIVVAVNKSTVPTRPRRSRSSKRPRSSASQTRSSRSPRAAGPGVESLLDHLVSLLPPGPFYFDPRQRSDQSESTLLAELVREQVLIRTREEVPHAVEVEIESISEQTDELIRIEAVVLVETESQKGILIGAGGRMIKAIGTGARHALERELGSRVHLALSVTVRKNWRTDERLLDRLGIE